MFYEAIYRPVEIKELNSKTKKFVGKIIALQYGGRIPGDKSKRQHCYIPYPRFSAWIAERDLKNLNNISLVRWKEIQKNF
ncbi:MAG TPA: hypothetical protein HPQ03_17565 [Deltaproteobacteria bacterium]|nr:hypothetical protein [Deltaproteobacteria bacterium]